MKIYTIIGGTNGVGKSSLSGILADEKSDLGVMVDTDMITAETGGDKIKGGKEAIRKINKCLDMGINFTQETTLSGVRILKTVKYAKELNYFIRLYYIGLDSCDESIKRIKNRVEKGGHDIPSDDVRRRYAKRFEDLAKILPYCNEVNFYDNENGFIKKAEYKNGNLIIYNHKNLPVWLNELNKYLNNIR